MHRRESPREPWAATLLALTAGAGLALQAAGQAGRLEIAAVVVDRSGAPVTDVKKEELEVWIGGSRVPIEALAFYAAEDGRGREIVLLLDDLTLDLPQIPRAREVARRFVTRMIPGDTMAIVSLSGASLPRTDDQTRLLRAIGSYSTRASGVIRRDELGADVLRTIAILAARMAEVDVPRKVIVGIGSAWLLDTPIPPPGVGRDVRAEWTDAMRALAMASASFYVVDPGGVGTVPLAYAANGFARETGGHAFVNVNDLEGVADRILREAASYYVIEVTDPPIHRKSELRGLDVRVLRRGLTVRARRAIPGRM